MRRWAIAIVILIACCAGVYMRRSASPVMLEDSDTKGLISGIEQRNAPLSWFTTDWPIHNHFYRPLSTLTLELNVKQFGKDNVEAWGIVNSLLCILSVIALFWLARELTDHPLLTSISVIAFSAWSMEWNWLYLLPRLLYIGLWLLPIVLFLPNRDWKRVLSAMLIVAFLVTEVPGLSPLHGMTCAWVPGRTATTMTVFALCALASYARYERLSPPKSKQLEATDLPSTKSARHQPAPPWHSFIWAVLSCLFLAAALASYEQAVMVPGLLVGVAIWMSIQRRRVRWFWQTAFWGILAAYFMVRHAAVPSGVSQYQSQQLKSGSGALLEVTTWLAPSWYRVREFIGVCNRDLFILVATKFPLMVWAVLSNLATYFAMAKKLPISAGAWAMSFLAFLPMAWLHRFDHYYFFPMALRAIFVAGLLAIAYEQVVIACSPRSIQAPKRLDPAPGSLLRL